MRPLHWFLAVLVASFGMLPTDADAQDTLTILHINDTHSNLASHGPRTADLLGTRGGIGRAATVVGMTRLTDPHVVFLHAGDLFIGDLVFNMTFGVPELQILQSLGLDAMAVGNHEFDLTPEALLGALQGAFGQDAHFPLLSANAVLDSPAVLPLKTFVQPHLVKQFGGVTVGIIGLTTPETNVLSLPSPAFIDTSLESILTNELTAVLAEGAEVVVLLSHMGQYYDRILASSVPYIHVIVGGHDHNILTEPEAVINPAGDTTWIVQAGAFYEYMGKMRLTVNGSTVRLLDYQFIPLDATIPTVPEVDSVANAIETMIAGACNCGLESGIATDLQIKDKILPQIALYYPAPIVQAIQNDVSGLAELSTNLPAIHEALTPVGGLMGLAYRSLTNTDLGLTVGGATAQPIARGHVTGFDLFRMIGYGFNTGNALGYNLATFRITGADLMAGLEWGLSGIELNDEYIVMGYPLRYTYTAARPAFQRLDSVWIWGQLLDPLATYSITTNEYVLAVMKDFVAPQLGMTIIDPVVFTDTTELQAVLWYLTGVTGVAEDADAPAVPDAVTLEQNFPNPFNPETNIGYNIQESGWVKLAVHDLLGREVAVLVDEQQSAGGFRAAWHAEGMPSGVYYYRLSLSSVSGYRHEMIRKMILVK